MRSGIPNPKRVRCPQGREAWYRYYAGFSAQFAHSMITDAQLCNGALVLDPWNGSGTSTYAAAAAGHDSVGYDVNPVSVILAKARLLSHADLPSIEPLSLAILERAALFPPVRCKEDPLSTWFSFAGARRIRSIERAIHVLLIDAHGKQELPINLSKVSTLAAFFHMALFRTVREQLRNLRLSNPTWIKRSMDGNRIEVLQERLEATFTDHVKRLVAALFSEIPNPLGFRCRTEVTLASSDQIPLKNESVDMVLSSPPYCTRIDYGVATLPELAIMGIDMGTDFRRLRDSLIGTPTITGPAQPWQDHWGAECIGLLERIKHHSSRASESYYLKTHVQYFTGISRSLSEISRCLKPRGKCWLVVQDSFYKEVYNNLPLIFEQMAESHRLTLTAKHNFAVSRTMAGIQPRSKQYRNSFAATESVICFTK